MGKKRKKTSPSPVEDIQKFREGIPPFLSYMEFPTGLTNPIGWSVNYERVTTNLEQNSKNSIYMSMAKDAIRHDKHGAKKITILKNYIHILLCTKSYAKGKQCIVKAPKNYAPTINFVFVRVPFSLCVKILY